MQFPSETINAVLLWRLEESARDVAYHAEDGEGGFRPVYYTESRRTTLCAAEALRARGLEPGDRVSILSEVRHEWMQADFAALLARLVTVGIYPSCTAEQAGYILDHSESRLLFIDTAAHLNALAPALAACSNLTAIVTFEDDVATPDGVTVPVLSFSHLVEDGGRRLDRDGEEDLIEHASRARPGDLLTIVYTSGTTGPPKGAMLTHRNLFHVCEAVAAILDFDESDRSIVYLPLAHILQRYTAYLGLRVGGQGWYLSEIPRLGEVIPIVRPTILAAVPRVLEKIHAKIMGRAEELRPRQRAVFDWAIDTGHQVATLRRAGKEPGWTLAVRHRLADRLVLSKIRNGLGGSLRYVASGGAPLAPHLSEWFHAIGILVAEGYGLSETSAPVTASTPDSYRFGTVGKAIAKTDIKIADDGEILVRGPGVFTGYFKDQEATAAAFTGEGFFRTGDVGSIDADGFVKITDRKKDIIVTAGGKNVAPANIENLMKEHLLIGQAMVCGDQQPYLVALIALDPEDAPEWADEHGVGVVGGDEAKDGPWHAVAELSANDKVKAAIASHIVGVNARLAPYETIKYWQILPVALQPENGYLTPTLKLKRRAILADYGGVVDALYEQGRTARQTSPG